MLHTRHETAKILGVSVSTLDNERAEGRITYIQYRPNGRVMISDEAISEYIAKATHKVREIRPVLQTYRKRRA